LSNRLYSIDSVQCVWTMTQVDVQKSVAGACGSSWS